MANNALKKPTASDIENMGDKIGNSLIEAQCALYALTAIHEVSKKNPSLDRGLPLLTQIIWRALFDRLYIKIGTVIEQSEKAANLQNLKKIAVQYVAEDQEALTFLFDLPTTNEK